MYPMDLGPELAPDLHGDGWEFAEGWQVGGGVALYNAVPSFASLYFDHPDLVPGKRFYIQAQIATSVRGGLEAIRCGAVTGYGDVAAKLSSGQVQFVAEPRPGDTKVTFVSGSFPEGFLILSDISVREVL